jgi:hypothetical protein
LLLLWVIQVVSYEVMCVTAERDIAQQFTRFEVCSSAICQVTVIVEVCAQAHQWHSCAMVVMGATDNTGCRTVLVHESWDEAILRKCAERG